MAVLSSEEGWGCFQRCLERIREGADAPLTPVIGSRLHFWAGLPKQSPVTDWYELLRQVHQYLKLDDFSLEALKDFPTLGWDSMRVAAARNTGKAAHQVVVVALNGTPSQRRVCLDRTPQIRDRYQSHRTTSTMAFFRAGFPVAYVPIRAGRRGGKSHISVLRDGSRFVLIILKIGALFSPMRFFLPLSLAFLLLGVGYYGYTYFTMNRFTNMSAVLLIYSLSLFLIGLVSEQISALHYRGVEDDQRRTRRDEDQASSRLP